MCVLRLRFTWAIGIQLRDIFRLIYREDLRFNYLEFRLGYTHIHGLGRSHDLILAGFRILRLRVFSWSATFSNNSTGPLNVRMHGISRPP
jgi:hypothetical protein